LESRFNNWHSEIETSTYQFKIKFGSISQTELNWKPNTESWSIGQVIEHLIKTNNSYFAIPKLIKSDEFKPSILTKIGFIPKLFGNLILKSVDPNNKRKVKTMKVFDSVESNINVNIFEAFLKSQKGLHNLIDENREFIDARTVIPSPVNKHIIYHFDTVIDILINHQKRHFKQASNVLEMMNNVQTN